MPDHRPIFVISDLHMGDGGPRDNFGHKDNECCDQLMGFLDRVEEQKGELVILGDLFEFWQMNLSRVVLREKNRPLIDRLGKLGAIYVVGNHDIDLIGFDKEPLLSLPLFQRLSPAFSRPINGRTIYFMHGHEVDPYNKDENPGKGRILTIAAGMAEDLAASPEIGDKYKVEVLLEKAGSCVLGWLKRRLCGLLGLLGIWGLLEALGIRSREIENKLSPAQNVSHAEEMLDHYADFREESNANGKHYDVLIVGHTHVPGRIGSWYYNTGLWSGELKTYAQVSPAGDVRVYDWNNGNPKSIDRELRPSQDKVAT